MSKLKDVADVLTSTNPVPLAVNCAKLAVLLYDVYSTRGSKLEEFASYMQTVGVAVEGMAHRLTGNAVPILQQLHSALQRATNKLQKYKRRNKVEIAYYAHSEAAHIKKITDQVGSLVPLLQLTLTGQNNMLAMHAELRAHEAGLCAQGAPAEAVQHVRTLNGAAAAIAAAESPADVHAAAQHVADSQMALSEHSMGHIASVHRSMQHALSEGFGDLSKKLLRVQSSQKALVQSLASLQAELKREMSGLREEISRQTGIVGDKLQGIEEGLAHVLEELQRSCPDTDCSTATMGCDHAARALMEALRSGRIKCTGCPVEGLPYTSAGPLRPVKLLHCGCTLSAHAADKCVAERRCLLCRRAIPASSSGYKDDKQIVRVAEAESIGIRVPNIDAAKIQRGARIGKGGEGVVYRGTLEGVGDVALKCLPLAGSTEQDQAQVTTMLTSTYLASTATPLVCRLHGVAWQEDEVWIVMELCEGTVMGAVAAARKADASLEGLPPADVVVLAMEVSEALSALHERARTLHLDLKPENILMTAEHKVRLSDFGVSRRLPTRITARTMTGISVGTPGYASPEQMLHRRGTARSDVYSLGASIIFAASGMHPYEGSADMSFIAAQLATGQPMPVPETVRPERLQALVTRMVAIDQARRPTLHQVRQELHRIHRRLAQAGERPSFVLPYWGAMPTTEPPPPVHAAEEGPETPHAPRVAGPPGADVPPAGEERHTAPPAAPAEPATPDDVAEPPFNTAPARSPFSAEAAFDPQAEVPPAAPPGVPPPPVVAPVAGAGAAPLQHGAFVSGPSGQAPPYVSAPSGGAGAHMPSARSGGGGGFGSGAFGGQHIAHAQSMPNAHGLPQQPSIQHAHSMPPFQAAPPVFMQNNHLPGAAQAPHMTGGAYQQPAASQLPGQTLPQLFDTMNQSMLGQHVDLGRATYSMPLLTKVRSLLDKSKNPITRLPDMDPQLLAQPVRVPQGPAQALWALQVASVGCRALTLWGGNTSIARGTLVVPEQVFLIFGPHCSNVIVREVYFKGGRVLCHGPTCSVRFENCRFSKCTVVAIGGANVSFFNCLVKHTDLGFYFNGPGTKLTIRKAEAVDCSQVLIVDGGASADVDSLQAKEHAITGVEARGPGTRLTLSRSSIARAVAAAPGAPERDPRLGLAATWPVRALHAHGGAAADVADCTLAASYTGVSAMDSGTTVTAARSFLSDNIRSGAAAVGGAALTLTQCTCASTAAPQNVGAEAGDVGTALTVDACCLQNNASCGVMAYSSAAVTLRRCVSQGNGTAGCFAQDNATIAMMHGCRSEMETGHSVQAGGSVTATEDCVFVPRPQPPQHAQHPMGAVHAAADAQGGMPQAAGMPHAYPVPATANAEGAYLTPSANSGPQGSAFSTSSSGRSNAFVPPNS